MPNDKVIVPPSSLFEYVIQALAPRSKHAIDLCAFNVAREKIAHKRKEKIKQRRHLQLVHSNSDAR